MPVQRSISSSLHIFLSAGLGEILASQIPLPLRASYTGQPVMVVIERCLCIKVAPSLGPLQAVVETGIQ